MTRTITLVEADFYWNRISVPILKCWGFDSKPTIGPKGLNILEMAPLSHLFHWDLDYLEAYSLGTRARLVLQIIEINEKVASSLIEIEVESPASNKETYS